MCAVYGRTRIYSEVIENEEKKYYKALLVVIIVTHRGGGLVCERERE